MNKPLVTFSILFYNQERFVLDAVNGALSQDYENMEIVLSDDCSSDSTYNILEKCVSDYKGPHHIILNRNAQNLGIAAHFNKVLKDFFHGEYLVAAGGDDISLPSRVSDSVSFMISHPHVQTLTTLSEQVDVNLNPIDKSNRNICEGLYSVFTLDDYCQFKDFILFSSDSRTYKRQLIEAFPPLSESKEEDLEYFLRSLLIGQVAVIRKILVKRRVHGENVSKKPMSVMNRERQRAQMLKDVEYALNKYYINQSQFNYVKQKIEYVNRKFITIDNSKRHPYIYAFFNRLENLFNKINYYICQK